jgi:hypothetical protein
MTLVAGLGVVLISLTMGKRDPIKAFGIILPAVAGMTDEQKLSKQEAMAALRQFFGAGEQPAAVREAIERLELTEDEGEFQTMLEQECVRTLRLRGSRH